VHDASDRRRVIAAGASAVPCPYCGSADTERSAVFGPFHMSEAYTCRACLSPFSRIKWGNEPAGDGDRRAG
jgi:hypothetical protein